MGYNNQSFFLRHCPQKAEKCPLLHFHKEVSVLHAFHV